MSQIHEDNQPVTQITVVQPEPGMQADALALMVERARFMARQPGFVSISLHRVATGAGSSTTFNGRAASCCNRPIARRSSAPNGGTSTT